jgi:transcriptional regulator with XRE-family HTH domain
MMRNMDEPRKRLGVAVRRRRLELGLSERQVVERAGMARNTWAGLESGERRTAEHRFAAIERALDWEPGSVDAILAGGTATPRPTGTPATATPRDEEIELVANDPDLDNAMKTEIIKLIYERRDRDRASGIEDTRRVIDLAKRRRGA